MNKERSFIKWLIEAPIADYQTVGDFNKPHSFKDKRDRTLITNPRSVERAHKKFANSDMDFNFIFVNKLGASKFQEVGEVDINYIQKNLGDDVAKVVQDSQNKTPDSVTIVFTNNAGAEKIPMTPWIIAHRIGHVLARSKGSRDNFYYKEASNYLISGLSEIMEYYGKSEYPRSDSSMINSYGKYGNERNNQLIMKNFFQKVATFRSARKGIIRDWFEVLNELIAQYITTGKIKFNDAPQSFKANRIDYRCKDIEYVNDLLDSLSNTMEYAIDSMLHTTHNKIYVM